MTTKNLIKSAIQMFMSVFETLIFECIPFCISQRFCTVFFCPKTFPVQHLSVPNIFSVLYFSIQIFLMFNLFIQKLSQLHYLRLELEIVIKKVWKISVEKITILQHLESIIEKLSEPFVLSKVWVGKYNKRKIRENYV